jgi:hypothetical protein
MTSEKIPFVFQERDFAFLSTLVESRVLTANHAAVLHFGGSREAAKKRLQKLKGAGLIAERKRRASEPAVLSLTGKAFPLLKARGLLDSYPDLSLASLVRRSQVSPLTLAHELEVMDVKSAFHSAIAGLERFSISEFTTWPRLHEFEAERGGSSRQNVTVKPDGFIRVHETEPDGGLSEHTFFLELDRSTETLDTLVSRAGCYLNYYRSGGFALKNRASRTDFKDYPFRVLMVFKSAERRNNIAERLLQHSPPILSQVCVATLNDATRDPFGPVWICPRDYRDATSGTPFDTARMAGAWQFRRQGAREIFVEQKIRKFHLLAHQD